MKNTLSLTYKRRPLTTWLNDWPFFNKSETSWDFDVNFDQFNSPFVSFEDKYTLTLEMPGVDRSETSIELDGGFISIKAKNERKSYSCAYTMPSDVDTDNIKSTLKDGILEIVLPRTVQKSIIKKVKVD